MELPSTNQRLMKVLCGLFLLTAPAVAPAGAQQITGEKLALGLAGNVVAIQAVWADGKPRYGFGFITGLRDEEVYIATADHVMRGIGRDAVPGAVSKRVVLRVFRRTRRTFEATLLGTHDDQIDLTVITARLPENFSWRSDVLPSDPAVRRDEVWFIGRDEEWYVPVAPGYINRVSQLGRQIFVDRLDVREGTSGAPVVSSHGIVGMVTHTGRLDTLVTPIGVIEIAFREWGHPWDLSPLDTAEGPHMAPPLVITEPAATDGCTDVPFKDYTKFPPVFTKVTICDQ